MGGTCNHECKWVPTTVTNHLAKSCLSMTVWLDLCDIFLVAPLKGYSTLDPRKVVHLPKGSTETIGLCCLKCAFLGRIQGVSNLQTTSMPRAHGDVTCTWLPDSAKFTRSPSSSLLHFFGGGPARCPLSPLFWLGGFPC